MFGGTRPGKPREPYAMIAGSVALARSPLEMVRTAASRPGITCSSPMRNTSGRSRALVESNSFPSARCEGTDTEAGKRAGGWSQALPRRGFFPAPPLPALAAGRNHAPP